MPENLTTTFAEYSVGQVKKSAGDVVVVWLIGTDTVWSVPANEVRDLDVTQTGDKFDRKICNICHCLLPVSQFARNQTNKHGIIRRPSCLKCRTDIDKRPTKSRDAKLGKKGGPSTGEPFRCPICRKRSIAHVTAKIVADHDHHTGRFRDFICDSCNTGLGRFKNGRNILQNAIHYLEERDTLRIPRRGE